MADSIRTQLAKNVRLRIGLALIIAIVGAYLTLDKSEAVTKHQKEYRKLSVQLEQARQQATDTAWLSRSVKANQALEELRGHDWIDSSNGLIQSKWNDSLQILLNQEKTANATVALSENVADDASTKGGSGVGNSGVPGMNVMKAKLRFEAVPKTLYNILQVIDTNKQSMVVETLVYNWLGTTGRAEINLKAFTHLSDQARQDDTSNSIAVKSDVASHASNAEKGKP
ncbi:hypothetical protein [Undibacterium terreum]|uniref:Uncharacterized protein n=1 Tax=Undibacterium terreum TaxID=1224302 RepID=A0A916XNS9_9BURK|nr:hypothetical protein [Undibacterium terreum]GGC87479.1 hypothetical protein GCM10011396_38440 [Undibacterium terreum]